MKKNYLKPTTLVVSVTAHGHILDGGSPVRTISSNTDVNYGGGSNSSARVKDQGAYNVWNDDWSNQ